jgi:hypothetical protein
MESRELGFVQKAGELPDGVTLQQDNYFRPLHK